MNWFERYGIVGGYFSAIIVISLYLNQYIDLAQNGNALLVAIFVALILPIGYILSIFSQWLYYFGWNGIQVHQEIFKELNDKCKQKLGICEADKEALLEAKITAELRLSKISDDIKYLARFATKRWDVLALNSALDLSNKIFWLFLLMLKIFKSKLFCFTSSEILMIVLTVIISIISHQSYKVLAKQIVIVNKKIWDKLILVDAV